MYNQFLTHFEEVHLKFLCGFWRGFNIQNYLYLTTEHWKHAVSNSKVFGALFTDLSKAFDCVCHDLFIAKLNTYGLSLSALKLVYNYLQKRKQKAK